MGASSSLYLHQVPSPFPQVDWDEDEANDPRAPSSTLVEVTGADVCSNHNHSAAVDATTVITFDDPFLLVHHLNILPMPDKLLPEAQSYVPYQAYKSKKHTRNLSNPTHPPNGQVLNGAAIPKPRPTSFMGTPSSLGSIEFTLAEKNGLFAEAPGKPQRINGTMTPPPLSEPTPLVHSPETQFNNPAVERSQTPTSQVDAAPEEYTILERHPSPAPSSTPSSPALVSQKLPTSEVSPAPSEASTSASTTPTKVRKASTFRHVPLRPARNPLPSSPLRPYGTPTSTSRVLSPMSVSSQLPVDPPTFSQSKGKSVSTEPPPIPTKDDIPPPTTSPRPAELHVQIQPSTNPPSNNSTLPIAPPPRTSSLPAPSTTPPPPPQSRASSSSTPLSSTPTSPRQGPTLSLRVQAPYRPGFQPKGVYRPRTEEFIELRREAHDHGSIRIERTKLERRLEKLISLHFLKDGEEQPKSGAHRPNSINRRASSFFDLDISDLKNMDPGGLWKSMMMQGSSGSGKEDLRAAEQRITPWEDDSAVHKCPLCSASFHPLTNRKHHCRLCGKIICSLPVKHPQRPVTCSLLFIVDKKTRLIEEVSEGVDYGVRKRRVSTIDPKSGKSSPAVQDDAEEKFLKGVRICRTCRPILTRQQFQQEISHVPPFVRLYEMFVTLEKEIEASLPQFEELLLSLTTDEHPTKQAIAARKRLLESFAQYDALSKRIRHLPCPSGPGSSQDRVQLAILTRANLFLQNHMFPLQTIPKNSKQPFSTPPANSGPLVDPDSKFAHALQPLLEQEALLESFIEEANAHRKFEDVKALQLNLKEIRSEINRIVANSGDS